MHRYGAAPDQSPYKPNVYDQGYPSPQPDYSYGGMPGGNARRASSLMSNPGM